MNRKRIAIFGISGLYNFGCEAIVRGLTSYLREVYNEPKITYYSLNHSYDKLVIKDTGIEVRPIVYKPSLFKRILNRVLRDCFINYQFLLYDYSEMIENNDVFYSIGGDIYTIPAIEREKERYWYYNPIVQVGERILRSNKKLVIFGASIGPFGSYRKASNYYQKHLSRVDRIVCREELTMKYLNQLGVNPDKLIYLPDPAFLVKSKTCKKSGQNVIGLNLSGLSIKETFNSFEHGLDVIKNTISLLLSIFDYSIMLIPHVVNAPHNIYDDDYVFLSQLYDSLEPQFQDRCFLASPHSFLEAKQYIGECKFVIAARMHCAVNTISENIPAIFVAYSQKSVGMCQYVYGTSKYCIPIKDMNERVVDTVRQVETEYSTLAELIEKRNSFIRELYVADIDRQKRYYEPV